MVALSTSSVVWLMERRGVRLSVVTVMRMCLKASVPPRSNVYLSMTVFGGVRSVRQEGDYEGKWGRIHGKGGGNSLPCA